MKTANKLFSILTLLALVLALTPLQAVHAAGSITVNSNADTVANDGTCTLREAITNANADSQLYTSAGECAAGAGADTITFAADYTITLASQLPTVTTEIILNGNGAANTIIQASTCNPVTLKDEGGNDCTPATYRVFEVTSAGNLTLDGLTVRNGRCNGSCATAGYFGGGVYNNTGAMTVSNVTFSANSATYGGGMYNDSGSSLTLTNVTFSANSADYGGGMFNFSSSPTLTNVTFSANSATWYGGGMYNDSGSSATLTNVTFSANSASGFGGGMYNWQSSPTLTNVTFSANSATWYGGGMYNINSSSPTLTNVIIADSSSGGDCVNSSSTVNAQNSLIEDGLTCVNGTNINNLTGDPMLDPMLADNGGSTQTHALLAGSPAINAGANCPADDQRGVTRPQGTACDIGAFEFEAKVQTGPAFVVNTNADPGDGICADVTEGNCSLRAALNAANAISGADTITFAADYTITLASQLPTVTTEIILNGNGAANTIIQASTCNPVTLKDEGGNDCTPATYRVFEVTSAGYLTLDGLTVRNGNCNGSCATNASWGGGVYNTGALTASNVTFSANSATNYGGGMYNDSDSSATLTNVTFSDNSATNYGGGGMFNFMSSPTLTNVTFSGNSANYGGGMLNLDSNPTLTNVTFSDNSATNYGGGMLNGSSSPTLTNVTFSANSAAIGGGMYNSYSSPTLTNTIIADSSSGGDCVNLNTSTVNAQNSLIEDGLTCVNGTSINNLTGDPMLNPTLADNGGSTQTHALLTGSPAIDAGTNTGCPLTDQRGITRPQGLFCDIGAVESETYTLTITSANGMVVKNPDQVTYHEGDVVQLTATPNPGWSFANWTGDLTGSVNPDSVTIHGNTSVTANYTQNEYTLTVTSAHGTVTKNPDQVTYHEGDVVQLIATPNAGWSFANWTGDLTGSVNPDSVTVHGNTSVTANYTQNEYTLTVTSAHGTVTKNPDLPTYHYGDVVQLTATPNPGWNFANWTGDLTGSVNPDSVTIHGNTFVTANYTQNNQAPTDLALDNSTVAENQAGGTTVGTFTSTDPDAGNTFIYSLVSGAGSADNAAFTISGNALQTAYPFNAALKNSYSIRVRTTDQGSLYFEKAVTVTVADLPAIFTDVPDTYWANSFIERLYNAGITSGCSLSPLMYCPETDVNRAQMAVFLLRGEHGSAYVPPAVGTGTGFTDVPTDYWAAAWIKQLALEGITSGCGPSLYCPEISVTRDQMAVFLLRAEYGASYTPPPATGVFTDVPTTHWAASWIEQLATEGITGGCGVDTYCPSTPVTRAQMAVFLVRTFNLP